MTPRKDIDAEKSTVRITLPMFFGLLCMVASGAWVCAWRLSNIDGKLASIQESAPSYWTIRDQERHDNWLRQDNRNLSASLVVRDTSDVIKARSP